MMNEQEKTAGNRPVDHEESEAIAKAFEQMEVLYRSRCVQAPLGSNVTVREIGKEE